MQLVQAFEDLNNKRRSSFTDLTDLKQEDIATVAQEQQLHNKSCFQSQQVILDQATNDNMIAINLIKDVVVAQRQMIDRRIENDGEQRKHLE